MQRAVTFFPNIYILHRGIHETKYDCSEYKLRIETDKNPITMRHRDFITKNPTCSITMSVFLNHSLTTGNCVLETK